MAVAEKVLKPRRNRLARQTDNSRARSFVAAARKQSKAVAASEQATADQQFIDAVSSDSAE
jgi:hypothetical protein